MRIIVQEPFGYGKKVCWLDPSKIKTIRDLLKFLRSHFGEDDPITGVKLTEYDAEIQDIKVLRDGDVLRIVHSNDMAEKNDDWVTFNVGGCKFSTFRSTIMINAPQSFLTRLLSRDEKVHCRRDNEGAFLIDRSPKYFEVLLNCLRNGHLDVPPGMCKQSLVREAQFYGIESEPLARLRKEFESKQVAGKHEWITFNVRGQKIQTYRSTILSFNYSNGMTTLADMINDNHPMCRKDVDGCYLLDRNPTAFQYVLEYLKRKLLYWPEALDSTYMYYECLDYGICDNAIKTLSPKQGQDLYGVNSPSFRRSRLGQWEEDNSVSDMASFQNPHYNNRRYGGRSSDAIMDMSSRRRNMPDSASRQWGSSTGYDYSYDRNMFGSSPRQMGQSATYDMYNRSMYDSSSRRMGPAANYDLQDRNLSYQNATNPRSNYNGRMGADDTFNDSLINVDKPQGILQVPSMRHHRRHSDALLDMNRTTGRSDLPNMNLPYQQRGNRFEGNFNEAMDTSNDEEVTLRVPLRRHRRHSTTDLLDMNRNRRSMQDAAHRQGSSWSPDVQDLNLAYQKAGLLEGNFRLDDNGKNTDFSFNKSDY